MENFWEGLEPLRFVADDYPVHEFSASDGNSLSFVNAR